MVISNQIISFKLSGINYTGTSTQLNYTSGVIQGEAQASKTLVLDINKSASGIGSLTMSYLSASSITGTIQTESQPNITTLGTLTNLSVNGPVNLSSMVINGVSIIASGSDINLLAGVTQGVVSASKVVIANSSRNISNLNAVNLVDLTSTGTITYKGTAITADGSKINYVDVTPGSGTATKALVLDASRDINNIRNLTATSVAANNLSGTLQTSAQPNITSLGTLTGLNMSGSISGVSDLTLTGSLVSNSVSATSVTGTLQTAAQPNVTSVGTLTSLNVNGSGTINTLTVSNFNIGSTQVSASSAELNQLAGTTQGSAVASKALVVDSSRDIGNIRNLTASGITCTTITGTLQTGNQPNVTGLGTLGSLNVNNSLNASYANSTSTLSTYTNLTNPASSGSVNVKIEMNNTSARLGTTTEHPLRFSCNNSVSMSLDTNGNVSIGTQATSAYRLNIAGSLNATSLNINGSSVNSTATELNTLAGVSAGTASSGRCLVVDANRSIGNINELTVTTLTTNNLAGTLQTGAQPNVTSVGTLSSLSINSSGNSLTIQNANSSSSASFRFVNNLRTMEIGLAGNGAISNANMLYILDGSSTRLSLDASGNFTVGGNTNPNGYKVNVIGSLNSSSIAINGTTVTANAVEINSLAGVNAGTGAPSKAVVLDASRDVSNIRTLTALTLAGTLSTAAQPNVTSVGTLTSLTLSGSISGVNDLTASGTISSLNLTSSNITGTLLTASQPNITSLGTIGNLVVGSNVKVGTASSSAADMLHIEGNNSGGLGMQIENRNTTSNSMTYVKFTGYSSSNDNYDLASIACGYVAANANYGYGYLSFSTRNNSSAASATERMRITEAGNVGIMKSNPLYTLDVDGSVNATEFRLSGAAITSTATDLNRLSGLTAGTAAASKALVLDASRDIINVRNFTAATLTGSLQTSSQTLVTELGTLINLSVSGPVNLTGAITVNGNSNFSNKDVSSINALSANTLAGTLQTSTQPNITSVGTLTGLASSGSAKFGVTANAASDIVHIEGSSASTLGIQIDNTSTSANSGTHIKFNGYNVSNSDYDLARITCGYVAANANYGYGYLAFATRNVSANSTASERMRITESGSVGIGMTNPTQALEVNGNIKSSKFLANSSDTARLCSFLNPGMSINQEEFITFGKSNTNRNQAEISFTYIADGSDLNAFRIGMSNSQRRMVLVGNGYMAVNMPYSTLPSGPLHVNQSANSSSIVMGYDVGNSSASVKIGSTTNNKLYIEGGALFASSNTPSSNGYVYINGADNSEIFGYGYVNAAGNTGYNSGGSGSGVSQISLRTSNRVVVGGELDIISDHRMKTDIQDLNMEYCKKFIENVVPKTYKYKISQTKNIGFIAQDIVKQGFDELFGFAREDVPEVIEEDGFVNPEGQIFTLNYEGMIPILTKCIQDLYAENKALKDRLEKLEKLE